MIANPPTANSTICIVGWFAKREIYVFPVSRFAWSAITAVPFESMVHFKFPQDLEYHYQVQYFFFISYGLGAVNTAEIM